MKRKGLFAITLSAILAVSCLASAQATAQESSDSAMEAMNRAKRLYRNGNYRGAIQELETLLTSDPARADALYLIGYSRAMLRDYAAAVDAFGRAFRADPTFDPRTIYHPRPPQEPMD